MNDDFAAIKHESAQLRDKLGKPVDAGILELVAALRYHNIHTIASCEGHVDRMTGGPYVMFEAPETHVIRQKYRLIKDKFSEEYKTLRNEAIQLNIPELKKVLDLLTEFYNQHKSPNGQHIIVQSFDCSVGELMCQSSELTRVLPMEERTLLLRKNQAEMQTLAEYLRFKIPPIPPASGMGG